jgi:hypothetical protein
MFLQSGNTGNIANPILNLQNSNATGSVAMEVFKNKPTASVNGDVLFTQSVYGKDSGNTKQEFTRINHSVRDVSAGVEDGSIEFGCFVNGAINTFLQINGNENEVNCLKTLDMGGNTITTRLNDMTIATTASTGTGDLTITAKGGLTLSSGGSNNTISNSSFQLANNKGLYMFGSSPASISTNINNGGSGEFRTEDLTNLTRAEVSPSALTITDYSGVNTYRNTSTAVSTIIKETDTSSVDIKKLDLETNLIRMNDSSSSNIEQIDIIPNGITFQSSGTATDFLTIFNDSADGGKIDWTNVSGTNGLTLTSSHSLTLKAISSIYPIQFDSVLINLQNTNTTTSTANFFGTLATTSGIGDITNYLKLQLNGVDIWIPYFTSDPSV